MLITVLIFLAALFGAVLIYAATRPDTFRIERSIQIKASPEVVFSLINNFHAWERWSPWENIDPDVQRSYNGPESGVGAVYGWQGNKHLGRGRMEIIESLPCTRIRIAIDFSEPFEAHNTVEFLLTAQGQATHVIQAMYGPSPFVSKLIGLFFSMDKMVGGKYEEGLASLKALAEK